MNHESKLDLVRADDDLDQALISRVRSALNAQVDELSVRDQMRLNEARARAVALTRGPAAQPWWRMIATVALVGTAATLSMLWLAPTGVTPLETEDTQVLAMFDDAFGAEASSAPSSAPSAALLQQEELATLDSEEVAVADDLEFYAWFAEHSPQSASGS